MEGENVLAISAENDLYIDKFRSLLKSIVNKLPNQPN